MPPDELRAAYRRLYEKIKEYTDLTEETLRDNPEVQYEVLGILQHAERILSTPSEDPMSSLRYVQHQVRCAYVAMRKGWGYV